MPLRFTDHRNKPALEQELRELWRVLDGVRLAAPQTNTVAGAGAVASGEATGGMDESMVFIADGGGTNF